ncbi:MAG: acetyl-CoA C-acyltransferase [Candidatus Puniceispirillum sp.]|nr:acetyl-CoA C-acyltransferase [Candidatus Pelagibacter sp.]MBA4282925.1 acetyl-CoA C-acyltransferase [Candidatus Puniceispirillum sp.]
MKSVYIYDGKRSPMGSFQGQLNLLSGFEIMSHVLSGLHQKSQPDYVILGNVLSAGQGQSPARQAVRTGIPQADNIPSTNINKVCGSGMFALTTACALIQTGMFNVITAGGFESMSQAPYLLPKARNGLRMGHGKIIDHMLFDGLEDAYEEASNGTRRSMGIFADQTAQEYQFSRLDQEEFAKQGIENYLLNKELLQSEIHTLQIMDHKKNTIEITFDEPPLRVKPEKFSALRPAFNPSGTVTAATSSSIADGANALILGTEEMQIRLNCKPIAKIVGSSSHAQSPETFTTAPVGAIQKLLQQLNWEVSDVDLFEVNEAFAIVPMAVMKDLNIERNRMNVLSGACTLGHPIGSSGSRIVLTLITALRHRGLKRGIASVCIGGGEAMAMAIEIV